MLKDLNYTKIILNQIVVCTIIFITLNIGHTIRLFVWKKDIDNIVMAKLEERLLKKISGPKKPGIDYLSKIDKQMANIERLRKGQKFNVKINFQKKVTAKTFEKLTKTINKYTKIAIKKGLKDKEKKRWESLFTEPFNLGFNVRYTTGDVSSIFSKLKALYYFPFDVGLIPKLKPKPVIKEIEKIEKKQVAKKIDNSIKKQKKATKEKTLKSIKSKKVLNKKNHTSKPKKKNLRRRPRKKSKVKRKKSKK